MVKCYFQLHTPKILEFRRIGQLATCDDRRSCRLGLPPYSIITHSVKRWPSVELVCAIVTPQGLKKSQDVPVRDSRSHKPWLTPAQLQVISDRKKRERSKQKKKKGKKEVNKKKKKGNKEVNKEKKKGKKEVKKKKKKGKEKSEWLERPDNTN
ncbi:hypothetical protein TNCV_4704411 [Trichonephila clavipes]|nr:hypothetical protein TNCV_4704411 [Trichonephila clavipes]